MRLGGGLIKTGSNSSAIESACNVVTECMNIYRYDISSDVWIHKWRPLCIPGVYPNVQQNVSCNIFLKMKLNTSMTLSFSTITYWNVWQSNYFSIFFWTDSKEHLLCLNRMTYFCLIKTFIRCNTIFTTLYVGGLVRYKRLLSPNRGRNAVCWIDLDLDMITHSSTSDRRNNLSGTRPVDGLSFCHFPFKRETHMYTVYTVDVILVIYTDRRGHGENS